MSTFLLVAGARLGGWCWRYAASDLRAAGHTVIPATLTGLGERAHLLCREIDLDTHVSDVVGLFEYRDLHDVILVGHSYGGTVITGVAERVLIALAVSSTWMPQSPATESLPGSHRASARSRLASTARRLTGGYAMITAPKVLAAALNEIPA